MRIAKLIFSLAALGYVLVCAFTYFSQEELIFHPKRLPDDYIFSFKLPCHELTFAAADGGSVSAIEFPALPQCGEERGRVLFIHGNASTIALDTTRPHDFTSRCWSALFIDYRPFGKSKGSLSPESPLLDATAAYNYLAKTLPSEKIIIYGQSLGTGIATKLAARVKEHALILEAPYLSVLALAEEQYPYLPVAWFLKFPFRSDLAIPSVKSPVVIIHGTEDTLIPYAQGEALSKLVTSPLRFVAVNGGTHQNLVSSPEYATALDDVMGKALN